MMRSPSDPRRDSVPPVELGVESALESAPAPELVVEAVPPPQPGIPPPLGDFEERPPLENRFSWSKSRHDIFSGCQRRYFLHYYAYWGGWDEDAEERKRRLYVLRRLSSKEQWAGIAVHEAIARALYRQRRGRPIALPELIADTRARMRGEWRSSSRKNYWHVRRGFGLLEHEYGDEVPREVWKANWDLVERCLLGLEGSATWARILASDRGRWKPIDQLDSFSIDGVEVWAAPDFAFEHEGGRLEIVDWKTGQPRPSDVLQLAAYAAFAEAKWGVTPDATTGTIAYLAAGTETKVTLDRAAIAGFEAEARASIAGMRSILDDPAQNRPHLEERYPKTEERWRCAGCSFRGECWEGGKVPAE